jgi:hypothetical protein
MEGGALSIRLLKEKDAGWQSGLKIVLSVKLINANMPIHENLSKSIDTY